MSESFFDVYSSEIQSRLPLFHQQWWLDLVAQDKWSYLIHHGENGTISTVFPISVSQTQFGLSQIVNPPLTPYLGPFILNMPAGKISTQLANVKRIYTDLIEQLPRNSFFQQYFSDQVTFPLPFFWHHFDFRLFYTYQLPLNKGTETIWNDLSTNTRKNIRKAERILSIKETSDPDVIWQAVCQTYSRQNHTPPFQYSLLEKVIAGAIDKGKGFCLYAVDGQNKIHGGVFIVWDSYKAYYLLAGADPDLRSSGASSLLLWKSIVMASMQVSLFDFYGSTKESIEKFVRGFGGKPLPILVCIKKSPEKYLNDLLEKCRPGRIWWMLKNRFPIVK